MFSKKQDFTSLQLVDFGFSIKYHNEDAASLTKKCGTWTYMAPEVYFNDEYSKVTYFSTYSMWTFGALGL